MVAYRFVIRLAYCNAQMDNTIIMDNAPCAKILADYALVEIILLALIVKRVITYLTVIAYNVIKTVHPVMNKINVMNANKTILYIILIRLA